MCMLKKVIFALTIISISLPLFISCDDFLENELNLRKSSEGGKGSTLNITVSANSVEKNYNPISPEPDPPLTYKVNPKSLPDGVSITGKLVRDSGEVVGTYAIRQGTLKLVGENASKYTLYYVGNFFSIKE